MVRETKLRLKKLEKCAGNPQDRDRLLAETYNISESDLINVRKGTLIDRIYKAAECLFHHTSDPSQISTGNLAAMVYDGWEDPVQYYSYVSSSLSKSFKIEKACKEAKYRFNLTCIQLLREEICGYSGNLYEARSRWQNFQPSKADWQRSTRIPLTIGFDESQLLGIFWADANVFTKSAQGCLHSSGSKDDFELYSWLTKRVKEVYHMTSYVYEEYVEREFKGKLYKSKIPKITIGSSAIVTWLKDDLGFNEPKENVSLPRLEWTEEQAKGFLSGIIAGIGALSGEYRFTLVDKDEVFLSNLGELAKKLGITTKKNGLTLGINRENSKKLYLEGLLLHPNHIEKFGSIHGVLFENFGDYIAAFKLGNLINEDFLRKIKQEKHDKIVDKLRGRHRPPRWSDDRIMEWAIDYVGGMKKPDILNKHRIGHYTFFEGIKRLKKEGVLIEDDLRERREVIQRTIDEDKRLNIVADYLEGSYQQDISKKYGIHFSDIYRFFSEFKERGLVNDNDMQRRKALSKMNKEYPITEWRERIMELHEYVLTHPNAGKADIYNAGYRYALEQLYDVNVNDVRREVGIPTYRSRQRQRKKAFDERDQMIRKLRLAMYLEKNPNPSYKDIEYIRLTDVADEVFPIKQLLTALKDGVKSFNNDKPNLNK